MLSQTVEYALRAVVTLAQQDGQSCTAQRLAALTHVPGPYLSKLMQVLVRAGLVRSQRGLHGGFVLARGPDELTIWDVVQAVEPLERIETCPLSLRAHAVQLCPLHRRLDEAIALVERSFRATTLAELLKPGDGVTPLCEVKTAGVPAVPRRGRRPKPAKARKGGGRRAPGAGR